MPTNILRNLAKSQSRSQTVRTGARAARPRLVTIKAGRVTIRAELADTPSADRIAAALPIHSTAETWGDALHFEVPVESGRERGARVNVSPGDICFWSSDGRVIIGFGPTPISRPGEIRLPQPCNLWALALDDVKALKRVRPGEKVSITAMTD